MAAFWARLPWSGWPWRGPAPLPRPSQGLRGRRSGLPPRPPPPRCRRRSARTATAVPRRSACRPFIRTARPVTRERPNTWRPPRPTTINRPEPADCLTCHTRSAKLAQWEAGPHARNQIQCRDCHSPHKSVTRPEFTTVGNRRMDAASAACATCHQDTAASLSLTSHHPVREGGVVVCQLPRPAWRRRCAATGPDRSLYHLSSEQAGTLCVRARARSSKTAPTATCRMGLPTGASSNCRRPACVCSVTRWPTSATPRTRLWAHG